MKILAIDPGRTLAWAQSDRTTGTLDLTSKVFPDDAAAHLFFMNWLHDRFDNERPDIVLVERAFLGGVRSAEFTLGLMNECHTVALQHGIPRREMTANSVRACWMPGFKATDKARIARARELGWPVDTDHEADAAMLLMALEANWMGRIKPPSKPRAKKASRRLAA